MTRKHTRLIGWTLALGLAVLFCSLGSWQLARMHEKQALLDASAAPGRHTLDIEQALAAPALLQRVQGQGQFLPALVLLDNQLRHGQAGLKVYQPWLPGASAPAVLVDLGWLPMPPDRRLPAVTPLQGQHSLTGLLAPAPAPGLALGQALVDTGRPRQWLVTRLEIDAVAAVLPLQGRTLAPRVLRLDPAVAIGYERDLDLLPNTLPPTKHLGYAVQWFAMAATVLLIGLVLEWRRRFPRRARRGRGHARMTNMNSTLTSPERARNRGRWMLLALFVLFFGSMLVAGALRFSGWQPAAFRNHGTMLSPPVDLRALPPRLASGQAYLWNPAARQWRVLVAPGAGCGQGCVTLSHDLDKVWQLLGHNADNVAILWMGALPAAAAQTPALQALAPQPALREKLPDVDDPAGTPVYVVDPNGFVILRYAPGFDPAGLRADLAKLLKLK